MNGTFTSEPVPFLRNLSEPGARFRAAAPNHPEALLEEPQAFQVKAHVKPQQLYAIYKFMQPSNWHIFVASQPTNPCLEPRNLRTLTWNLGTFTLGTLLGNSEPAGTFTWNPIVWNLGTFTWNLETLEPAVTFT